MDKDDGKRSARIRALNDELRCGRKGGRILITAGLATLGEAAVTRIMEAVAKFDAFTEDNDPYSEHDCATLEFEGVSIIWKIDYYDGELQFGSSDPADPNKTARVLTVMRSEEY